MAGKSWDGRQSGFGEQRLGVYSLVAKGGRRRAEGGCCRFSLFFLFFCFGMSSFGVVGLDFFLYFLEFVDWC